MNKKNIIYVIILLFLTISVVNADDDYWEDDDWYRKIRTSTNVQVVNTLDQTTKAQIDWAVNNFYNQLINSNYSTESISSYLSNILDNINSKLNDWNISEKSTLVLNYLKSSIENKITMIDLDSLLSFDTWIQTTTKTDKLITTFTSPGWRVFKIYQSWSSFYFIRPDWSKSSQNFPTSEAVISYIDLNTKPVIVSKPVKVTSNTTKTTTTPVTVKPTVQAKPVVTQTTTTTVKPTVNVQPIPVVTQPTPTVTTPVINSTTSAS